MIDTTQIRRRGPISTLFRRLFRPAPKAELELPASGIIHDLSNPLTVLSLSIEQLKQNSRIRSAEARRHIEAALRASKKMRLFLSSARKQIGGKEAATCFNITEEIESAIRLFRSISRKSNVKIKYRSQKAVFMRGDETKFFRVASNIISNAIDSYASFPREQNKIVIVNTKSDRGWVTISVRDFGCGIPKHLHKTVFEPFYTTKQKKDGSMGLGLAIVKNIVESDFGGKIKIESAPGRGALFKIILPI